LTARSLANCLHALRQAGCTARAVAANQVQPGHEPRGFPHSPPQSQPNNQWHCDELPTVSDDQGQPLWLQDWPSQAVTWWSASRDARVGLQLKTLPARQHLPMPHKEPSPDFWMSLSVGPPRFAHKEAPDEVLRFKQNRDQISARGHISEDPLCQLSISQVRSEARAQGTHPSKKSGNTFCMKISQLQRRWHPDRLSSHGTAGSLPFVCSRPWLEIA
jgi:hypothetical protein